MATTPVFLFAGLVLLAAGAELLVRGAARLALTFGVSPLVIGLTVVAFGTSAPELTVSVGAAWTGASDLALGNVVGSNILNVLCILGIAGLIRPLVVSSQIVRREVPVMILVSFVLLVVALDGTIGRVEGSGLLAGIVAYTMFSIRLSRAGAAAPDALDASVPAVTAGTAKHLALVAAGLALLVVGTGWVVDSAVLIARALGVSDLVIGLTLVAAGTSLPELATSVLAVLRGQRDIAVGNVVGSSIFNVLAILGLSALVAPIAVSDAALRFDIPIMVAVAVASLPIALSESRITRPESACLLLAYVAYATYLILDAGEHERLPAYRLALTTVGAPLATIALLGMVRRWWRAPVHAGRD